MADVSYHIAQYTNIIQELREEILRLRHRLQDKTTSPHSGATIHAVQGRLQAKNLTFPMKILQIFYSTSCQCHINEMLSI